MSESQENKKSHRKITLDMILASTSLTRSSKDSAEAYLARVTHLHMQRKKIRVIEGLELCTNLKVISLIHICLLLIYLQFNFLSVGFIFV